MSYDIIFIVLNVCDGVIGMFLEVGGFKGL